MNALIFKSKKNHSQSGQSFVEFAFGFMILIVMVVGIVDLSRAIFTYMALRDAAQEGALVGSINPGNQSLITERINNNSDLINSLIADPDTDIDVQITVFGAACTGNSIRVAITYNNFPITMPFLGALIGKQIVPIRVQVTDTILSPPCP
jgi:Flp pilus assembly protein TadG